MRELCQFYPKGRLSRFSIVHPQYSRPAAWLDIPLGYADYPMDSARCLGFPLSQVAAYALHKSIEYFKISHLITQVIQFNVQQKAEMVWAILDGPVLIYLARRVANAIGLPLVVSILDPPERWDVDLRLDPITQSKLRREFSLTLQTATQRAVISEGMQAEYKSRYGIDSVILRHGVSSAQRRTPSNAPHSKDRFIVGFCGSPYARREIRALISALSSTNWSIEGVGIILRVVCERAYWRIAKNKNIEYLEWRSEEETIELMTASDASYVPYWFDVRYQATVQLCFPTKLSTYLAASRPIIYHGPAKSSITDFFSTYPVGVCCHSLEAADILLTLQRLIHNRDLYASAVWAGQRALDEEMNSELLQTRFTKFLGAN